MNEDAFAGLMSQYDQRWIISLRQGGFHATHRRAFPPVNFEDASPEGLAGQLHDWEKEQAEGETIERERG